MSRIENFKGSIRRHGVGPTLLRYGLGVLARLIEFEVCRVESRGEEPYLWPDAKGYETRVIGCDEFHLNLCEELEGTDYRWAFGRGDLCAASTFENEVVGYNFSSIHPTRVRDGLVFEFPAEFSYSFASYTAPSYRGKKLERDRWKVARAERDRLTGTTSSSIWYINIANLESLAANKHAPFTSIFHGYAGYLRFRGRWICFRSPGCRRSGAGFAAVDASCAPSA